MFKKTLKKRKALFSTFVAFAMAFAMLPAFAHAEEAKQCKEVDAGTTGSITITGLEKGDTVNFFPLVNTTYNAADNTLTNDFVEALKGESAPYADYDALAKALNAENANVKEIVEQLAAKVAVGKAAATAEANEKGTAVNSGLPMGYYLITVTPAAGHIANVYQVTTANLIPEVQGGKYVLCNQSQEIKKDTLKPVKKIGDTIAGGEDSTEAYSQGDAVPFVIEMPVPQYPSNAIAHKFVINDKMSEGLEIPADGTFAPVVKIGESILAKDTNYTVAVTNAQTFSINIKWETLSAEQKAAGAKATVTYNATINGNAKYIMENKKPVAEFNDVYGTISSNPWKESDYETEKDHVDVYTFDISLIKKGSDGVALKDAEFTVYKGEEAVAKIMFDENSPEGKAYYKTDKHLAAGTYTVEETKVPAGYQAVKKFTVKLGEGESNDNYQATANVEEHNFKNVGEKVDAKQGKLPVTGGPGTIALTLGGIALIAGAAVYTVRSRKNDAK